MGVNDMEICSNGHPLIAHTEGYKNCPLCKVKEELNSDRLSELEKELNSAEEEIEDLKEYREIADTTIKSLRQRLKEHGVKE